MLLFVRPRRRRSGARRGRPGEELAETTVDVLAVVVRACPWPARFEPGSFRGVLVVVGAVAVLAIVIFVAAPASRLVWVSWGRNRLWHRTCWVSYLDRSQEAGREQRLSAGSDQAGG
ncbi:unnamed protein product [Ectocarpus sp. 8 AP-2014]